MKKIRPIVLPAVILAVATVFFAAGSGVSCRAEGAAQITATRYSLQDRPDDPARYAKVRELNRRVDCPDKPLLFTIASVPVSSVSKEMERGEIATGDERVNRLVKNCYWSMLSNYLSVPPGTTASLRLPGCEVMELSEGEFIKTIPPRKESAPKCIVTYTFDDGLLDQYELAYPMFREAGLKATFFIIGSKIGNPDGMRSKAESRTPTMTWAQIREMAECGMEIASHGWAHGKYSKMDRTAIFDDMRKNQVAIKENAGVECRSFAAPYNAKAGGDGLDVREIAKEAGLHFFRMHQKAAGGKMTAERMNEMVEKAEKNGEWLVFMIHGIARGYDAWENPDELRKHLQWVKEQNGVRVATFAEAASFAASERANLLP